MIIHCSNLWCGRALSKSLYLSQASKRDLLSCWMNLVIWFIRTIVLLNGKYLARNAFLKSFQMVIELAGRESNHNLALSMSEKGNKHNHIASGATPLDFNVSASWINTFKCLLRFSVARLENWFYCRIYNKVDLSSKFPAAISGLTILVWDSLLEGKEKSLSGLWSWSSAIVVLIRRSKLRARTYLSYLAITYTKALVLRDFPMY